MSAAQTKLTSVALLLGILCPPAVLADGQAPSDASHTGPRAIVARWVDLHRQGNDDEASALTTGSPDHRAHHVLTGNRKLTVRVERSLGNRRAAAVITNALRGDGVDRVLVFWLVRRKGTWRINKSYAAERRIVDERLRGFLEADDVQWHVRREALLGHWEAGPCTPPGGSGIACGSQLQFTDDNRYRLTSWGPGGPPVEEVGDHIKQGSWRLVGGRILLLHQGRGHVCRVAWVTDDRLVVESLDGKGRAEYERTEAPEGR